VVASAADEGTAAQNLLHDAAKSLAGFVTACKRVPNGDRQYLLGKPCMWLRIILTHTDAELPASRTKRSWGFANAAGRSGGEASAEAMSESERVQKSERENSDSTIDCERVRERAGVSAGPLTE